MKFSEYERLRFERRDHGVLLITMDRPDKYNAADEQMHGELARVWTEVSADPETRVAVMGDSDFAANGSLGIQGNRDLFMNIVGWLSQQENLISIRPKEPSDRRITLTATEQSNIAWLSLLIIPAAVFGTGIFTWWRRR